MKRLLLLIIVFAVIGACSLFAQLIVINELLYDPLETETTHEWVELFNLSSDPINLFGWRLEWGGTSFDYRHFTFSDTIYIQGNSYLLIGDTEVPDVDICAPNLSFQNGGTETDGVRIISVTGDTIDTILYDSPNKNNLAGDKHNPGIYFATDVAAGHSLMRFPDGSDTDNCAEDFHECVSPTPGSTNRLPIDLSIAIERISPHHADSTEHITITACIQNHSAFPIPAHQCSVSVFLNSHLSQVHNINEPILGFDEYFCSFSLLPQSAGWYECLLFLEYPGDDCAENNYDKDSFIVGKSPVIITEVLCNPADPNVEWIELYNRGTETLNIQQWKIKDAGTTWGIIVDAYDFLPQTYLVIAQNADAVCQYYSELPCFVTNAIPWRILNNSGDSVIVADAFSTILDTMHYSATIVTCEENISLERCAWPWQSFSSWACCVDTMGATPGQENSRFPKSVDISVGKLESFCENGQGQFFTTIKNKGLENLIRANAHFFIDENENYVCDPHEEKANQFFDILTNDSLVIRFETDIISQNYFWWGIFIDNIEDENPENNKSFSSFNPPNHFPVVINEIQFDPSENEPEWIEIYNTRDMPVELFRWIIRDAQSNNRIQDTVCIQPHGYAIFVQNQEKELALRTIYPSIETLENVEIGYGLPTLNNEWDYLCLYDIFGSKIDSVEFSVSWWEDLPHSIERISVETNGAFQENWERSTDKSGGSPGRKNSIALEIQNKNARLSVFPECVSLRNKRAIMIEYHMPEPILHGTIRVFDLQGRLVQILLDQERIGSHDVLLWDCRDKGKQLLPIGVYILYMEAMGEHSRRMYEATAIAIIGEK